MVSYLFDNITSTVLFIIAGFTLTFNPGDLDLNLITSSDSEVRRKNEGSFLVGEGVLSSLTLL